MVRISRKEAIFDGLYTKEGIIDALPVDNEDVIEEELSEGTVMERDNFKNECRRETEDDLNIILLQNHKEVKKRCSRKKKSPVWAFFL